MAEISLKQATISEQEDRIKIQVETLEKQKIVLYAVLFGYFNHAAVA